MTRKVIAAGFTNVFYGVLDADGMLLGTTLSLNAGNTAGSGMTRFEGAKSGPISVPEPDVVTVTGDDEAKGSFTFDSTDLANCILTTSIKDENFEALCMGLEVVTLGDIEMVGVGQPENPQRRDMCFIFQRRAKSRDVGEIGVSKWEGIFIPKATVTPMYAAFEERTPATYQYKVTLNKSDRMLWGETFGLSTWGTEQLAFHQFITDNPITLHAWRGDGVETGFYTDYTPASAAKLHAYKAGVYQSSGVTVTPATKLVTFGTAPASDQIAHGLYEYTT
jgi:hypothetical protein